GVPESAAPFEPRPRRQPHLPRDLGLGFLDRAAEIAVTYAELDRQVAFLLLAVDVGCARQQPHVGDLAQRNLCDAVRSLRADAKGVDGVRALPGPRRPGDPPPDVPGASRAVRGP